MSSRYRICQIGQVVERTFARLAFLQHFVPASRHHISIDELKHHEKCTIWPRKHLRVGGANKKEAFHILLKTAFSFFEYFLQISRSSHIFFTQHLHASVPHVEKLADLLVLLPPIFPVTRFGATGAATGANTFDEEPLPDLLLDLFDLRLLVFALDCIPVPRFLIPPFPPPPILPAPSRARTSGPPLTRSPNASFCALPSLPNMFAMWREGSRCWANACCTIYKTMCEASILAEI
jgi:hypothetical protein